MSIRTMLKRRSEEQKTGNERWLVSYADLVTLLFAFFVVMYSVSQVNEEKYRTLADTLNQTFSDGGASETESSQNTDQNSDKNRDGLADLRSLSSDIKDELAMLPIVGGLRVKANEEWIELTLNSEAVFDSGSATPKASAQSVFESLADILSPYENEIQISGHTDDVPISTREFRSNWALSSARAIAMVDYLSFQGITPARMSAIAYGEFRPVADNSTEQGRRDNRRVVIRISGHGVESANDAKADDSIKDMIKPSTATPEDLETLTSSTGESEATDKTSTERSASGIQPVRLKGGDLLFTADPDLPRLRELESETP